MAFGAMLALILHGYSLSHLPFVAMVSGQTHDDSAWYIAIATKGYWPQDTPFFPLFPAMIAGISQVTGMSATITALVISNGLFIIDLYLLWVLSDFKVEKRSWGTAMIWAISPFAIWLASAYTETLFIGGILGTLIFLQRHQYGWAALFASVSCLSRNEGIVLAVPYLSYLFTDLRGRKIDRRSLYWLLVPIAALMAYPGYLLYKFGNATLFSKMELLWGRHFESPWITLWDGFSQLPYLLRLNNWYGRVYYSLQAASVLLVIALLIYAWHKVPRSWWWMSFLMFVIPLCDPGKGLETITYQPRHILDYFFSFDRFTLAIIPLWIPLSMIKKTLQTRLIQTGSILLMGTSTLISLGYFLG